MKPRLVLVTGASGYIGGKLIPLLLERGYGVRCLVRDPSRLAGRSWAGRVEIVRGDLAEAGGLTGALQGVWTAYYLVHNMASGRDYAERDLAAARLFACAAAEAGVEHIIYLGGLADPQARISPHMRSRIETGQVLQACGIPVTEFRAGVIVGPGSISFEMIRYLAEQFPLMIGPHWLKNRAQPIAAASVFDYLLAALEQTQARGRVYEIGGDEVLTYAGVMLAYARLRGLRRGLVTLPGIPVWLMAFLVERLTPVPRSIARPLIEGLQADSLVRDDSARRAFPAVQAIPFHEAVTSALAKLHPRHLELSLDDRRPIRTLKQDGFCLDVRQVRLEVPPATAYRAFRLLAEGAVFGSCRVEALEPGRHLRLRFEHRFPGEGWLEWRVSELPGGCLLTQAVSLAPRGLPGFLFWSLLAPIRGLFFARTLERIAQRAVTIYNQTEEEGNNED